MKKIFQIIKILKMIRHFPRSVKNITQNAHVNIKDIYVILKYLLEREFVSRNENWEYEITSKGIQMLERFEEVYNVLFDLREI